MDLVLNGSDPGALAEFWREALDYREYYTDASVAIRRVSMADPEHNEFCVCTGVEW